MDVIDPDDDNDGFGDWEDPDPMDPGIHPPINVTLIIEEGLDWLTSRQNHDGSWIWDVGVTALCVLSYLNNNITEENDTVANAIDYLVDQIDMSAKYVNGTGNISFHYPPIGDEGRGTYYASMAILALKATLNPEYLDEINTLGEWLAWSQWDEDCPWENINNTNWKYGGFGYGGHSRSDLSNTQWALMGLDAWGNLSKDHEMWEKAIYFIERCQYLEEYNTEPWAHNESYMSHNSGGFVYLPNNEEEGPHGLQQMEAYGSMTAAGIWSYMLCGIDAADERIQAGLDWFTRNYTWEANPGWGEDSALYYYYLTLAKAFTMTDTETIEVADGYFTEDGNYVWVDDMVENLTGLRVWNESYWLGTSFYEENGEMATAYALLSLETQTLAEGANLSAVFTLHSNATLHLYDEHGNHVGLLGDSGKLEVGIPGAEFTYNGYTYHYSEEAQNIADGGIIEEMILLPIYDVGTYTLELIGISTGDYELDIQGFIDHREASRESYEGFINPGEVHVTTIEVTAMVGPLTLYSQEPEEATALTISPGGIFGELEDGYNETWTLNFSENSGLGAINNIQLSVTDLESGSGTIPGSTIDITPGSFDLNGGTHRMVEITIDIPEATSEGVFIGKLNVISSQGSRFIPINIEVLNLEYNFSIKLDNGMIVEPGETAVYNLTLKNKGEGMDTVDLEIIYNTSGWKAVLSSQSAELGIGETVIITLEVTASADALGGEIGNVTVKGISRKVPMLNRTAAVSTQASVPEIPDLVLNMGPFTDSDGNGIEGATITIQVEDGNYTYWTSTDVNGNVSFTIPLEWKGWNISVVFTHPDYRSASGKLVNIQGDTSISPEALQGWSAPVKKPIVITLGPFVDGDGEKIANATIRIVIGGGIYNDSAVTGENGKVTFSIPAKWAGYELNVTFSHKDYTSSSGILNNLIAGSFVPGTHLTGWTSPESTISPDKKGDGDNGDDKDGSKMWILFLVIAVIILVIIIFLALRQKNKRTEDTDTLEDEIIDDLEDDDDDDWGEDDEDALDDEGGEWDDEEEIDVDSEDDGWDDKEEGGDEEDSWEDDDDDYRDEDEDDNWDEDFDF